MNEAVSNGGALKIVENFEIIKIIDSKFIDNHCEESYAYSYGGAIYFESSNFFLENSVFYNNFAKNGAAIFS